MQQEYTYLTWKGKWYIHPNLHLRDKFAYHDENNSMPQFLIWCEWTINKRLLQVLKDIEYIWDKITRLNFSFSSTKSFPIVREQERWRSNNKGLLTWGAAKSHENLANFVQNNCFVLISLWWGGFRQLTLMLFSIFVAAYIVFSFFCCLCGKLIIVVKNIFQYKHKGRHHN